MKEKSSWMDVPLRNTDRIYYLDPDRISNYHNVNVIAKNGDSFEINALVLAAVSSVFKEALQDNGEVQVHTEVDEKVIMNLTRFITTGYLDVAEIDYETEVSFKAFGINLTGLDLEKVPAKSILETLCTPKLPNVSPSKRRSSRKTSMKENYFKMEETDPENILEQELFEPDEIKQEEEEKADPELMDENGVEDENFSEEEAETSEKSGRPKKKKNYPKVRKAARRVNPFYFPQEGERNPNKKYQCKKCVRGFTSRYQFQQHTYRHEATDHEKPWFCILCSGKISFVTVEELREHRVAAHKQKTLCCPHCTKAFNYPRHLANHVKQHAEPGTWHHCICCGKKFDQERLLKNHLQKKGPYHNDECPVCPGVKFQSWKEHQQHVSSVHDGNFGARCNFCPKWFETDVLKRRHIQECHNASNRDTSKDAWRVKVICEQCGKYVFKGAYKIHLLSVHGTQNLKCEKCDRTFKHEITLKRHVKEIHAKVTCEVCGKVFSSRNYNSHFLRKHTAEHLKPYRCSICDPIRGFIAPKDLAAHMNTHTMDRPHVCHLCSAAFRSSGNLYAHIRGTHKGIKRAKKK